MGSGAERVARAAGLGRRGCSTTATARAAVTATTGVAARGERCCALSGAGHDTSSGAAATTERRSDGHESMLSLARNPARAERPSFRQTEPGAAARDKTSGRMKTLDTHALSAL